MPTRPRAGVDMDGVLYPWESHARFLLYNQFGIKISPSPHYNWIQEECIRLGRKDAWDWLWGYGVHWLFSGGDMYPDARVNIRKLQYTHDIVIITRRPRGAIAATLSWLGKNGVLPSEVLILHDNGPKSAVSCDWYVDDSPDIVEELFRAGKRVYVFDRPWNQNLPPEVEGGVTRVLDWDELMRRVGQ